MGWDDSPSREPRVRLLRPEHAPGNGPERTGCAQHRPGDRRGEGALPVVTPEHVGAFDLAGVAGVHGRGCSVLLAEVRAVAGMVGVGVSQHDEPQTAGSASSRRLTAPTASVERDDGSILSS